MSAGSRNPLQRVTTTPGKPQPERGEHPGGRASSERFTLSLQP